VAFRLSVFAVMVASLVCVAAGCVAPPSLPAAPSDVPADISPAGGNATYAYAGSSSQLDVYTYPSPSPMPSTDVVTAIRRTVKVFATTDPFGGGAATDQQSRETDASPYQTQTIAANAYYQTVTAGKTSVFELYGSTAVDDANDAAEIAYVRPQTIEKLPLVAGTRWTNDPAQTSTLHAADGNSYVRRYRSDGSYVENDVLYDVDGSGNYPEVTIAYSDDAKTGRATFAVDYRLRGKSKKYSERLDDVYYGSPGRRIAVSFYQRYVPLATPSPAPSASPVVVGDAPNWIGASPFYRESDTVGRAGTLPKSCRGAAASAVPVERDVSQLDAALGTLENSTIDAYVVPGKGTVCVVTAAVTKTFYDYNQDWWNYPTWNPPYLWYLLAFATSAKVPLETSTFHETLVRDKGAGNGALDVSQAVTALETWRALQRAHRIERLISHALLEGGVRPR